MNILFIMHLCLCIYHNAPNYILPLQSVIKQTSTHPSPKHTYISNRNCPKHLLLNFPLIPKTTVRSTILLNVRAISVFQVTYSSTKLIQNCANSSLLYSIYDTQDPWFFLKHILSPKLPSKIYAYAGFRCFPFSRIALLSLFCLYLFFLPRCMEDFTHLF